MSAIISGTINVTHYSPYSDDDIFDNVLFNIFTDAWLVLAGDDQFHNVTAAGAGQLRVRGPLEVDGLALQDDIAIVNSAKVTQHGTVSLGASDHDAVLARNLPGATWDVVGRAEIAQAGPNSRFINLGLFEQTGAANTTVTSADFYSRGTVHVEGKLNFTGAVTRLFGSVEGAGQVTAGTAVLIGASLSCAAFSASTLRVLGEVTSSTQSLTVDRLVLVAARLSVASDKNNSKFKEIVGQGEVNFAGATQLEEASTPFGSSHFSQGGVLTVGGQIALTNAGDLSLFGQATDISALGGYSAATIQLSGGAHIVNQAGATWTDAGYTSSILGEDDGLAVFINLGVFVEGSFGHLAHVQNEGVMKLGPGRPTTPVILNSPLYYPDLEFLSAVDGSGEIDVGPGEFRMDGAVAAQQDLVFVAQAGDPAATLFLADVRDFAATVTGFAANGASDDRLVIDESGWSFADFAPNAGGTGGALIFSDGAAQTSVSLLGSYDPAKFHAAISGTRTTITYG